MTKLLVASVVCSLYGFSCWYILDGSVLLIVCDASDRVGTKISMIYINDIYRDSIMIFSSENVMIFLIFSKYQPLLLLFA